MLTLFRMGLFGDAHGCVGGGAKRLSLLKICHTNLTMKKLGTVIPCLKKIQKVFESCNTPPLTRFADISVFSPEFCYIKKYRYRLHFNTQFLIVLAFFESLKIVLINMVTILTMSEKLATLDFLKIKIF